MREFEKAESFEMVAGIAFNYIRGSVFTADEYGADGLIVFVPCGLTAMRVEWSDFGGKLGEPDGRIGDCVLFENRANWKLVIGFENIPYSVFFDEVQTKVVASLQLLQQKGVKNVAMNGLRIDMMVNELSKERSEQKLVTCVKSWCQMHPSVFESIAFFDLRGGFNVRGC